MFQELDAQSKLEPMDNFNVYNFCELYLYAEEPKKPILQKKYDIASFNCVGGVFNRENLIPNKTILDIYNQAHMEFLKRNPDEDFSEYLYAFKMGYCQEGVVADIPYNSNPTVRQEYLQYKQECLDAFENAPQDYEYALEYKTDEAAYLDTQKHTADKLTKGGIDWRQKQVLETLKKGHYFELYVSDQLKKRYGIDIGLFYAKDDQEKGESATGVEFKYDVKSLETGNIYLETKESRHGEKPVPSGIMKDDNTEFFVIGTADYFMVLDKAMLAAFYEQIVEPSSKKEITVDKTNVARRVNRKETKDGVPFLASDAFLINKYCLKDEFSIDFGIDGLARVLVERGVPYDKMPPERPENNRDIKEHACWHMLSMERCWDPSLNQTHDPIRVKSCHVSQDNQDYILYTLSNEPEKELTGAVCSLSDGNESNKFCYIPVDLIQNTNADTIVAITTRPKQINNKANEVMGIFHTDDLKRYLTREKTQAQIKTIDQTLYLLVKPTVFAQYYAQKNTFCNFQHKTTMEFSDRLKYSSPYKTALMNKAKQRLLKQEEKENAEREALLQARSDAEGLDALLDNGNTNIHSFANKPALRGAESLRKPSYLERYNGQKEKKNISSKRNLDMEL